MYKVPIPMKAIPMALEESFTPAEMMTKICFKLNEAIERINNFNTQINDLKEEITNLINEKCEETLSKANQYTDERIREVLNADIITARDFDELQLTAQEFDNLELTAWTYDTASALILIYR